METQIPFILARLFRRLKMAYFVKYKLSFNPRVEKNIPFNTFASYKMKYQELDLPFCLKESQN